MVKRVKWSKVFLLPRSWHKKNQNTVERIALTFCTNMANPMFKKVTLLRATHLPGRPHQRSAVAWCIAVWIPSLEISSSLKLTRRCLVRGTCEQGPSKGFNSMTFIMWWLWGCSSFSSDSQNAILCDFLRMQEFSDEVGEVLQDYRTMEKLWVCVFLGRCCSWVHVCKFQADTVQAQIVVDYANTSRNDQSFIVEGPTWSCWIDWSAHVRSLRRVSWCSSGKRTSWNQCCKRTRCSSPARQGWRSRELPTLLKSTDHHETSF